jgi:hypothetical protein
MSAEIIEFTEITSLDQIDYDKMFDGSYPSIEYNFFQKHKEDMTYEQKKNYYRGQLEDAINGTSPLIKSPNETFFMFKADYDNITMEFVAGYIEADNETFRVHWLLTQPDLNQSKNAIYSSAAKEKRTQFYNERNILYYKAPTIRDSEFYRWMKYRNNSGAVEILEEYPTFSDASELSDFVTLKMRA